jgi:hypothetical protein
MVSNNPLPELEKFFSSAGTLLLKSSASIAAECHKEMDGKFSLQLDQDLLVYECMAMLGSIVLHEAHSKTKQASAVDINQSYRALKESLRKMSIDDPQKQKYAEWFNDETFHNLIASYFIGVLAGFHFSQEEIQDTSTKYGMKIPTAPGIDAMFFGLLVRLFRVTGITKIENISDQKTAAGRIIQFTETGISSFGLELQKLA